MNLDEGQTLETLQAEVAALKARVTALEDAQAANAGAVVSNSRNKYQSAPLSNPATEAITQSAAPASPGLRLDRSRLEEYIGGRLLNWVGALIVVFAVAYFLKWSFDNQIIGEMGRCILGLICGIGFMAAGQICQKRGLRLYAQGLIGAGIAIIYLASFAAVNYYHLITPYIAFSLMFITAITGGILAALDNAPTTAIIAAIGGFLVPFLMGSHTGRVVPLLSYVLILNLGVLFLAYYRQWIALDILALIGTAVISVAAQSMDWQVWPGQTFLTTFLILFIIVAANYNRRSGSNKHALLFLSTVFFSIVSFGNVIDRIDDWRGLFTLTGAVILLVSFYLPPISRGTTVGFRRMLLLGAMIFALLTAPLHLDEVYRMIAWLGVAAVLLHISRRFAKILPFAVGLLITIPVFCTVLDSYVQPYLIPVINSASLLMVLCAANCLLALLIIPRLKPGNLYYPLALGTALVSILFYLLHFDISNAIYYYQANQSFSFLIPVAWALVSSLVLFIGARRNNKTIRLLSLVLYGVVIIRTLFYDLRQLDIVYKILVLLAVGLIALAISFFYQKRMKGDVLP